MLSVVIPCYKSEPTIIRCIESVLANSYVNEVIVVENGIKDNTYALLEPYVEHGQVIYRFSHIANRAAARNIGARLAKSEYVAFVDCDVFLEEKWSYYLLNQIRLENTAGGQGKVYPLSRYSSKLAYWLRDARLKSLTNNTYIYLENKGRDYPSVDTAACIYKKCYLEQVNYFDESLVWHEDIDLSNRISRLNKHFSSCKEAVAYDCFFGGVFKLLMRNVQICFYKNALFRKDSIRNNYDRHRIWKAFLFTFPSRDLNANLLQRLLYFVDGVICHLANLAGMLISTIFPRFLYSQKVYHRKVE